MSAPDNCNPREYNSQDCCEVNLQFACSFAHYLHNVHETNSAAVLRNILSCDRESFVHAQQRVHNLLGTMAMHHCQEQSLRWHGKACQPATTHACIQIQSICSIHYSRPTLVMRFVLARPKYSTESGVSSAGSVASMSSR